MDYKDLTALLIKTAATVVLFYYIAAFPGAVSNVMAVLMNRGMHPQYAGMEAWQAILQIMMPVLLGLALSLFVFLFPRTVSNKLVSGPPVSSQPEFLANLQYVALRLLGLFYISRSLVDLSYYVVRIYAREPSLEFATQRMPSAWGPEDVAGIASSVLEIAVALGLVLGARGIVGIVDRLRDRGE